MIDLSGRRVLVTGASSGLGRAIAIIASRAGASVVLVGRDQQRLEQALGQCEGAGHVAEPFDLNQCDEIPDWLGQIAAEHGPLSGLVHSAGISETRPIQYLKPDLFDKIMRVNLNAAIALAKGFRKPKVHAKPASLVFISSVLALVGQPGTVAYTASKGALTAATRTLALEWAGQGIRVNAISPGHVETEMGESLKDILTADQIEKIKQMHPLGFGTPDDVANAAVFLLADTARWITGTTLVVDGGYTCQ